MRPDKDQKAEALFTCRKFVSMAPPIFCFHLEVVSLVFIIFGSSYLSEPLLRCAVSLEQAEQNKNIKNYNATMKNYICFGLDSFWLEKHDVF